MTTYEISDGEGSYETIEATDLDAAKVKAADWCRGGDWGEDGARISVTIRDEDGEELDTVEIEIEPNHSAAIVEACGGRYEIDSGNCCGDDPDDHEWTSEGEGGCDENPGVWSTGGTAMVFKSHCKNCGLHRTEYHTGSQYNPGEHDRVEYEWIETEA